MQKKIYLKNPLRLVITFLVAIFISMCFMLLFQNSAAGDSIPEYATIIVSKGDTLWSIASDFCNDNEDIRSKIQDIKELNNINSSIYIGQELKVEISK